MTTLLTSVTNAVADFCKANPGSCHVVDGQLVPLGGTGYEALTGFYNEPTSENLAKLGDALTKDGFYDVWKQINMFVINDASKTVRGRRLVAEATRQIARINDIQGDTVQARLFHSVADQLLIRGFR